MGRVTVAALAACASSAALANSGYVVALGSQKAETPAPSPARSPFSNQIVPKAVESDPVPIKQPARVVPTAATQQPRTGVDAVNVAEAEQQAGTPPSSAYAVFMICAGEGLANKMRSAYQSASYSGSFSGNVGSRNYSGFNSGSASSTAFWTESIPFDEQVNVELSQSDGRIRMPRAMLPLIRGGQNGWMKINDLHWNENEIIGSVGVNFINNPKLRIDRLTGAISINGKAGDFAGYCEAVDPSRMRRKF